MVFIKILDIKSLISPSSGSSSDETTGDNMYKDIIESICKSYTLYVASLFGKKEFKIFDYNDIFPLSTSAPFVEIKPKESLNYEIDLSTLKYTPSEVVLAIFPINENISLFYSTDGALFNNIQNESKITIPSDVDKLYIKIKNNSDTNSFNLYSIIIIY